MKPTELAFAANDPGAVKYGNFINYYTFHSAQQRIENFDSQMFPDDTSKSIVCLDIGCNTGELTKQFLLYLQERYPDKVLQILAVDIDPLLISRAKEMYNDPGLMFKDSDITTASGKEHLWNFLLLHSKKRFDIVFCFSVTMWIHLNTGDEGLTQFLEYIKDHSKTIIMESQPWNCYRNAQRRVKKSGGDFPLYHSLKIRGDVDKFIEEKINKTFIKVYESPSSSWKRKIQSFHYNIKK